MGNGLAEEEKRSEQTLTLFVQRNLPARGFRPSVMLLAMGGVMVFGFWKVGKGIREQKYVLHTINETIPHPFIPHDPLGPEGSEWRWQIHGWSGYLEAEEKER